MEVIVCSEEHADLWQQFVNSSPHCCHYHQFGWKRVIERAYSHKGYYLMAVDNEAVAGVLPLILIRSRIFGRSLTSLPFVDVAGLAAAHDHAQQALLLKAKELAEQEQLDYVELRQQDRVPGDFYIDNRKVSLTMELGRSAEELWKSLPSERRNRIRKARQENLEVDVCSSEQLVEFYRIWTHNMRDLGSPAHSLQFFRKVFEEFPDSSIIFLVRQQDVFIGAAIGLVFRDTLSLPWVSSLRKYFRLYPNNILYWRAMEEAVTRKLTCFDFGRSSFESGTYQFKLRWGASAKPLFWQFLPLHGKIPSLADGDNPKFKLAVSAWKLIPVALANKVGPLVRKYITV